MYSSMHEGMKEMQLGFFCLFVSFFILRIFKNKFLHVTALAEKKCSLWIQCNILGP